MEDINELFGKKGIDTEYERSLINYSPVLNYEKVIYYNEINNESKLKMKRAKEFSVKTIVDDYKRLIKKTKDLMKKIEIKNKNNEEFEDFKNLIEKNEKKEIIEKEEKISGKYDNYDAEFYSILFKIKNSIEKRKNGLEKEHKFYIENEEKTMENWEESEVDFIFLEEKIRERTSHGDDDEEEHSKEKNKEKEYYQNKIKETEMIKERYEKYHTATSDIGYVQKNRIYYIEEILNKIEDKLENGFNFFEDSEEELKNFLKTHKNKNQILSHMIVSFDKVKEKTKNAKQNHLMFDSDKEEFFSKEQYQLHQIETKANLDLVNWLYFQPENDNFVVKEFSNYLIDSIKESSEDFQDKNANLLKFYKQENIFFKEWISGIEEKEKIRSYIKLLKK